MTTSRFLYSNGVVLRSPDAPQVAAFLESHPGAYTTTRTHNNATTILFWEKHLRRLANSAKFLVSNGPHLFFASNNFPHSLTLPPAWDSVIGSLVNDSVSKVLPVALSERRDGGEQLAITGDGEGMSEIMAEKEGGGKESFVKGLNVHVHIGSYVPPSFGIQGTGVRVAVVGPGRDFAKAKYTDWIRIRKNLENFRSPSVTELVLSNDGDRLLEGCVTKKIVVRRKDNNESSDKNACPFEVQTAPINDGVLPGIIRQLVIEEVYSSSIISLLACLTRGIPIKEVPPSWSKHDFWQEAFITSSLRIIQNVEKIQVPSSWESLEQKTFKEISWEEMQFGEEPGMITSIIQKEIMKMAGLERFLC